MVLAIGVGIDMANKRESGFDCSLRGPQEWPPTMFDVNKRCDKRILGGNDDKQVVHPSNGAVSRQDSVDNKNEN